MSSLKALLSATTFDTVDNTLTSNPELENANCRKRGAVLEEWLLRKFPELYEKSQMDEPSSTAMRVNDVENQPLNLVKRIKHDADMETEATSTFTYSPDHSSSKTLRTSGYNQVHAQLLDTEQETIINEHTVLPKAELVKLSGRYFWQQISDGCRKKLLEPCNVEDIGIQVEKPINLSLSKRHETACAGWNDVTNGVIPLIKCETEQLNEDCSSRSENTDVLAVTGSSADPDGSSNDQKQGGGSVHLHAANKHAVKRLTTPKLTKHNDAAYYPNIQCLLCREWVCSRNRYPSIHFHCPTNFFCTSKQLPFRYMHVESHLQYRPYKCSFCGYDNRKEIFIILHIKKVHGGRAEVIRDINTELEREAWNIAERCVEHTRDLLQRAHLETVTRSASESTSTASTSCTNVQRQLLMKYSAQYRPKLYNTQRAEKSLVIEDSLKMGIVPDFSEVSSREVQCQVRFLQRPVNICHRLLSSF
ncbi:unnamed protein product [Gongylonema pulchrum]|uniref:C2H2-type domain-containing protein n=1 Tax=Gongylonema pulchrum TaxID=637853 RepID=A0A183CVK9_9BILA|nr:unnamed protein product [Gongylonema pulchrum]